MEATDIPGRRRHAYRGTAAFRQGRARTGSPAYGFLRSHRRLPARTKASAKVSTIMAPDETSMK